MPWGPRFIRRVFSYPFLLGFLFSILLVYFLQQGIHYTSSDRFCNVCHVHPQAMKSWKRSSHVDNPSGVVVHCVECHLPAGGLPYYLEKARLGIQEIFIMLVKDPREINWEAKSHLDQAVTFTYRSACLRCHKNLFPLKLSRKGEEGHLHYTQNPGTLRCLNCHLQVGHYSEKMQTVHPLGSVPTDTLKMYTEPTTVHGFENFTEHIPGSSISFEMVAIPGGTFQMGSPSSEPYRHADEGPMRAVQISPFWIGKTEVTWDEYEVFYRQTSRDWMSKSHQIPAETDMVTGATPPYGNPDQGWGRGKRPAITMTHHAATVYCRWLSQMTGKTYRLPTEAEWEYACRGGTTTPYFFPGNPKQFSATRFWNKIFGIDTTTINSFVIYRLNSRGKTHLPGEVKPNPFGLLNMAGNVKEFCLDWYAPDTYLHYPPERPVVNPRGPAEGQEHVIRGGSFRSGAADVRSAARDFTHREEWQLTDPQIPKSLWWYSDCDDVGFRVVCEYKGEH